MGYLDQRSTHVDTTQLIFSSNIWSTIVCPNVGMCRSVDWFPCEGNINHKRSVSVE